VYIIIYKKDGKKCKKVFDFKPVRTYNTKNMKKEDAAEVAEFIKRPGVDYLIGVWDGTDD